MKAPMILTSVLLFALASATVAPADVKKNAGRSVSPDGLADAAGRAPVQPTVHSLDDRAAGGAPRATPSQMAFQGFLQDAGGSAVTAAVDLDLALYDVITGGSSLWSETQSSVAVADGVFSIALGSVNSLPLSIFDGTPLYLGISVNGESEMPRTQLLASAFALRAAEADHALTADVAIGDDNDWTMSGPDIYRPSGRVGIGTTAPSTPLHVTGTNMALQLLDGTSSSGYTAFIGVNNDGVNLRNNSGSRGFNFKNANGTLLSIDPAGTTQIGSPSNAGELEVHTSPTSSPSTITDYGAQGGSLWLYDEGSTWNTFMGPDLSSGNIGGQLQIKRDTSNLAFLVDGNFQGSNNGFVSVRGASRFCDFNMNASGNASVVVPVDAIGASEIADEPGIGHANSNFSTGIGSTTGILNSRLITAPTSGYIVAFATAELGIDHTAGSQSFVEIGLNVDVTNAFQDTQDLDYVIPASNPSGEYNSPVTVHAVFSVSAGTHTVYLLGKRWFGSIADADVSNRNLTVMFIPTSYGTVSTARMGRPGEMTEDGPMTDAMVAAAQNESVRVNDERIASEMAEMRARLEETEAQMREILAMNEDR